MLALLATSAQAIDRVKDNNVTALNDGASWVGGVAPNASDRAVINSIVTSAAGPALGGNVSWQGIQVLNPAGTFTITGTSSTTLTIGTGGIDMSSATADLTIRGLVSLNGDNIWNVADGRTLLVGGTASQIKGTGGLTKLGAGTLNLYNQLTKGNTFTGNVIVGGGTVLTRGGTDWLGAFGSAGTITIQDGGTVNDSSGNNGPFGNPGTLKSGNVIVQTGGLLTMADGVTAHIPRVLVLSGGTLGSGAPHATYGSWNLDQGVIVNGGTATSVISAQGVTVNQTGGTVFNVGSGATSGIDLDVTGYIGHFGGIGDRGVIKTGAGVMRLSGFNTYTSNTAISNGVLALSGSGSIASTPQILVCSGATLDVSGLTSTFSLNSAQWLYGSGVVTGDVSVAGGTVNPGFSSPAVAGTLSFSNNLTLSSATCTFKLSNDPVSGANDQIAVAGDLTLDALSTLRLSYTALGAGRYKLITYRGTLTGTTNNLLLTGYTAGGRQMAYLDDTIPNEIDLVVVGLGANLTWVGDGLANDWDVNTTRNWFNSDSAAPDYFIDGDFVTLNDSGLANPVLNLVSALSPAVILVTNNSGTYTFSGAGFFSGSGRLVKQGAGTLLIANYGANDFTGPTTIAGGTVSITGESALGAVPGSAIPDQLTLNGGTLQMAGGVYLSPTRGITLGAAGGALQPTAGNAVTVGGLLSGAGTLTVNGGGTVELSQADPAFTGNVVISGSGTTVRTIGGTTFGGVFGVAGTITVQSGAILETPSGNNGPFGLSQAGLLLPGNVIVEAGGLLTMGGASTTAHIPRMLVLSGGELASTVSPVNAQYGSWNLEQGVTVNGGPLTSVISAPGVTVNQLGGTVFNVGSGATNGIDLDVTGFVGHYTSVLNGDTGLIKKGPGVMRLAGANTYTGRTTISNGTLLVTGSTGSGAVSVTANGTLGGTGTIGGLVSGAGNISPGTPGTPGTSAGALTLGSGLNLSSGGTYLWKLAANSTSSPGTDYDQLALTGGNLVLGGSSKLQIEFVGSATAPDVSNPFWQSARSWRVVSLAGGSNPGSTIFAVTNGRFAAGFFTTAADAEGIVLNFTPGSVPQPVLGPNIAGLGTANATINWSALSGLTYQVQYKDDLNVANWSVLANITATGETASFTDTTGPVTQRFYRVVVP